jgi:hypothetical protein
VGLTGMGDTATVAHIMPPMPAAPRMQIEDLIPAVRAALVALELSAKTRRIVRS